nr:tail protein [uncultured bacterium]
MASNADMKLQLIIEAINKSEAAFAALKKDLAAVQTQTAGVDVAGAKAGQALQNAGEKGGAGMKHIHDQAHQAHSMLGQMVQMAIIMGALFGSKQLFEWGMGYNKTLETSKLGLSAIITSMGVVTDAQGRVLQGQEKWNASQSLSVEAQKELQKIGMTTAATYTELVEVYQGILAPALSAKMTFAETLEITGLLTNSVKALGLPINQIKQEARDLIQGGINAASSSLATALGVSDKMVKKWREQGTVYDELKKRLEGFVYASKEFSDTWEGAWSNFQDVAQRALGEGSKPLFAFIRSEVIKLTADMTNITRDASGKIIDIEIKPEVVARIRELAEDLKELIIILEAAVKWGIKLSEPIMWGLIAVGIGKITTAVQGLATATGAASLSRFFKALPVVAGILGGKFLANMEEDNNTALGIRSQVTATQGHAPPNIEQFGWKQLREVREKLPTAVDEEIAAMLRSGIIAIKQKGTGPIDRYEYSANIDDAAAKKFLAGDGKSPFGLKGPDKQTDEQAKKERAAAMAALEDSYAEAAAKRKAGEAAEAEAIKTGLKEKELLYQQGLITQEEYLKARAEIQKNGLTAELNSISAQQAKLTQEYKAKASMIEDPKEASEAHKAYVTEWYKLETDYIRKAGALKQAATDSDIADLEQKRKLEAAGRDGALRLLQERLNNEKQLNQLLQERGRLTPLEAEKRDIANEQSGLEAEYWKTFGEKKAATDSATIKTLESQLQLLEERLAALDQKAPERLYKAGKDTAALDARREEARISHELAALDEKEKLREVSKIEALRSRKVLLDELLTSQLTVQAGIDQNDTTAWNTQQSAIDATRQRLLELKLEMRGLSDDMAGGLTEGISAYIDQVGGVFEQMKGLATATAQGMESAFSTFFFDAMTGKMKSLSEYVTMFTNQVLQQISQILAQKAAAQIGSSVMSLFSGAPTDGSNIPGNANFVGPIKQAHMGGLIPEYHTGGKVLEFHMGGLSREEVPAVLLKRERVLSRDQNVMIERMYDFVKGAAQQQPQYRGPATVNNISISAIDSQSFHAAIQDNKESVAAALASLAGDNHPIRRR